MKKSLIIVIIIVALVLVFGLNVYFKNKNAVMVSGGVDNSNDANKYNPSPATNPIPATKPAANDEWPLKRGSKGEKVKLLQVYVGVEPDGDFGPKTEAAVKVAFGKTVIEKNDLFQNVLRYSGVPNREKSLNPDGNYFPLKTGTTGFFVRMFQLAAGITVDGKFGNSSLTAARTIFKTDTVTVAQLQALISNKFFGANVSLPGSTEGNASGLNLFAFLPKLF